MDTQQRKTELTKGNKNKDNEASDSDGDVEFLDEDDQKKLVQQLATENAKTNFYSRIAFGTVGIGLAVIFLLMAISSFTRSHWFETELMFRQSNIMSGVMFLCGSVSFVANSMYVWKYNVSSAGHDLLLISIPLSMGVFIYWLVVLASQVQFSISALWMPLGNGVYTMFSKIAARSMLETDKEVDSLKKKMYKYKAA